ncbi:MAG: septum formation initiator family protein [Peptococcaceae bacterium]|nr:septum formation initiator family protein [Peptococcaceae bacterium]
MAQRKKMKMNWRRVLVAGFALYVLCQFVISLSSIVELKKQEAVVEAELEAAYKEQAELEEQIDYMQSEEAIEKTAREKLGLIKEGEILIQRALEE